MSRFTKARHMFRSIELMGDSSKPPRSIPMTLLVKEDLAWEKFQQVVNDVDIAVCYDMSLKEFEHSIVHNLFKVPFFFFFFGVLNLSYLLFSSTHLFNQFGL